MSALLNQVGLVFEIAGALILAMPGLVRPARRERLLRRIDGMYIGSVVTAFVVTAVVIAFVVLRERSPLTVWGVSMLALLLWLPGLAKWSFDCLPGIGEPRSDWAIESLHCRGFGLLALGFLLQSVAAALR